LHLDIRVKDVDEAERAVVALGARRVPAARETGFRVFVDPVGHPFCLVFGQRP
jgi:Glyoxalase-like domain